MFFRFFCPHAILDMYDIVHRYLFIYQNILNSEINKYLCLIIQHMKNVHIIIAILLVSLVVLYR